MESKNRNLWIILAVIVVVVCCCVVVVTAAGVGWFTTQSLDWTGATSLQTERSEESFAAGDAPSLTIDNFAGNVTVRTGESGVIQVAATKKAQSKDDLDRIEVDVSERDGGLTIRTRKPSGFANASVELEITAPAATRLDARTGAGNVDVRGLAGGVKADTGAGDVAMDEVVGEIEAHSGAGRIGVRGAAGTARLDTGAGNVEYQGTPQGECRFETGAGNITLHLPTNLNVEVDLEAGMGNIDVAYAVDGQVTRTEVRGVIGDGSQGSIYAHSGAGNIDVVRR